MSKHIILDSRTNKVSVEKLISMGYNIVSIPSNKCFDLPISAHPDIFITQVKDRWFADISVKNMFTFGDEINFLKRETGESKRILYPLDCSFNCVSIGNNLICNEKITHSGILDYAEKIDMNIIHTNQGYSKCSVCKVSENAIMTEDNQIYKAAVSNGINSLLIEKGYVKLDGYEYGFIGGCTGLIETDLLAVNGDINKHPNHKEIIEFCDSQNVKILCLNDEELYDIGTIIRI